MMALLVSILLAGLALAFVLYPLLRRGPRVYEGGERGGDRVRRLLKAAPTPTTNPVATTGLIPGIHSVSTSHMASSADVEREQAARDGLREVELDFQLGNIAEEDYRTLRERYMQRALIALKSRYDREQELDEMIEEQLRKMKEKEQEHNDTQ